MTIPTIDKNVIYGEGLGIINAKDGEYTATFRGYGIGHSKGQGALVFFALYFMNRHYQQIQNLHF